MFNWIETMRKQYKILPLQVGYDRYSAQYLISEGGLVTVTFSDDYAQRSAAGDPLAVAVEFTTSVANLAWDQAG